MTQFYYRYIDYKGKKRNSAIEAETLNAAKENLRRQKIAVLDIYERKKGRFYFKQNTIRLTQNDLMTFTTQLSQLLFAGMPLYESLVSLEEQYREENYHCIILSLCEQIKRGKSLSLAMRQFPDSFNELYCSMVAAGESVGTLDKTLEKLSLLIAKQRKLKQQLSTALIYPTLLFVFSFFVCFLLLTFVIPSLETLFEDRSVNRFTASVMAVSRFLTRQWMYYIPLLMLTGAGSIYFFTSKRCKLWFARKLLLLPILKNLIIQTAMARFCRTMGTLLQGGVPIIESLKISCKVMNNASLEEVIQHAQTKIVEGSLLSHELKKSPLIPSLVPRLLAIGEEGGSAPLMFQKIADLYEEDVDKTLSHITALAQPVVLVIMGAVVGLIMLAVLLPLTDSSAFL